VYANADSHGYRRRNGDTDPAARSPDASANVDDRAPATGRRAAGCPGARRATSRRASPGGSTRGCARPSRRGADHRADDRAARRRYSG
jgi:hypothetical protein